MGDRRRLLGLALLVAALFALAFCTLPHTPAGLRALIAGAGPFAVVAFLAVWTLATPAMISGTLLAAAGGILFGPLVGSVLSVVGATCGGCLAFSLARRLGGRPGRGDGRAARFAAAIERRGFRSVLCLRAAPAVPATVVNYAAGLTRIRLDAFAAASLLGGAPRAVAYTLVGSAVAHPSALAAVAPTIILIAMAVIGLAAAGTTFRPRFARGAN